MLWEEVANIKSQLDEALSTCRRNGYLLAEAEKRYRIAKAKKELELKKDGFPVTLIIDQAKGDDEVSQLAFERDCALVTYKANTEAILVKKLELKIMESELEREYGSNEQY